MIQHFLCLQDYLSEKSNELRNQSFVIFFVERERIYIINKTAASPVKKSESTCYLVSTLETLAVFELKAAAGMHNHVNCRDHTRSVSSLTSLRTLFLF